MYAKEIIEKGEFEEVCRDLIPKTFREKIKDIFKKDDYKRKPPEGADRVLLRGENNVCS